jgi:hypothetical protein
MAKSTGWASIIRSVQTPLGFSALVVLVVESILGGLAVRATGRDFTILVVGMLTTVLFLVVAVFWTARSDVPPSALTARPQPPRGVGDSGLKPVPDSEPWTRYSESVSLCFEHRANARQLFRSAFTSGTDVYLLTIKSRNVFSLLDTFLPGSTGTRLHVLTWDPGFPRSEQNASIVALHRLTPDSPSAVQVFTKETLDACGEWTQRTTKWNNISIGVYGSTPTLEGYLVKDRWAVVEPMPFGVPTESRAALILMADKHPNAFAFFQKAFLDLWHRSDKVRNG